MKSFFAFAVFAAVLIIGFWTSHATSQDPPRTRENSVLDNSNPTYSRSRRSVNVARDSPTYGGTDRPTSARRDNTPWGNPQSYPAPVPIDATQPAQAFLPVPPRAPQFGQPSAANDPVTKVVDSIMNADSDEVRRDKLEELKEALESRFDSSLEAQEAELEALEARVKKLRDAVETRRKNRERIISNYLDGISLQAEGLTIPGINQRPMPAPRDPQTFQGRPTRYRYRNDPLGAPATPPEMRQPRAQQAR